jgi:hypothetical protein
VVGLVLGVGGWVCNCSVSDTFLDCKLVTAVRLEALLNALSMFMARSLICGAGDFVKQATDSTHCQAARGAQG